MDESDPVRRWVRTWQEAGPKLKVIRRREVREAQNLRVLAALESAFNQALHSEPPRPTSGMVHMQEYFAKLHPARRQ